MEEQEKITAEEARIILKEKTSLKEFQIKRIIGEEKWINKSLIDKMIELKPKVENTTEKTSNIIAFPKVKVDGSPPTSLEELSEKIAEYKTSFAEEISEVLWNFVLGEMARAGCDFDKDLQKYYPSMVMILESIKSLHLQTNGIHHPLQDIAAESFTADEGNIILVQEDNEEE